MSAFRISRAAAKRLEQAGILQNHSASKRSTSQTAKRSMNRLERDYADLLQLRQSIGEVKWWKWEAIKLRLADRTWYTPDFFLVLSDGSIEVHETKGWMRDDANVKLKVAAEMYPWRFVLVKKECGDWTYTEIPGKRGLT